MTERAEERFADWVDERMSEGEKARFEADLLADPVLRRVAEEYREIVSRVRATDPAARVRPPRNLVEAVLSEAGLSEAGSSETRPGAHRSLLPFLSSMAAAAAMLTIYVLLEGLPAGRSSPDLAAGRELAAAPQEAPADAARAPALRPKKAGGLAEEKVLEVEEESEEAPQLGYKELQGLRRVEQGAAKTKNAPPQALAPAREVAKRQAKGEVARARRRIADKRLLKDVEGRAAGGRAAPGESAQARVSGGQRKQEAKKLRAADRGSLRDLDLELGALAGSTARAGALGRLGKGRLDPGRLVVVLDLPASRTEADDFAGGKADRKADHEEESRADQGKRRQEGKALKARRGPLAALEAEALSAWKENTTPPRTVRLPAQVLAFTAGGESPKGSYRQAPRDQVYRVSGDRRQLLSYFVQLGKTAARHGGKLTLQRTGPSRPDDVTANVEGAKKPSSKARRFRMRSGLTSPRSKTPGPSGPSTPGPARLSVLLVLRQEAKALPGKPAAPRPRARKH